MENLQNANPEAVKLILKSFLAYEMVIDFDERYSVNFEITETDKTFQIRSKFLTGLIQKPFTDPQDAEDSIEIWNKTDCEVWKTATLKEFANIMSGEFTTISDYKFNENVDPLF